MNLVESVRRLATPKLAESISAVLGITPERITAALDSVVPGLLAAVAARAQTPEDAHALARTLDGVDESILADPAGAVSHQGATLINRGGDLLGSLLGGASLTALIGAIGRYTGKSPASIRSIVGLFAPIALAALRRERAAANLDEAGLARMLAEQKPHITAAIPPGLAHSLATAPNVGALGDYIRASAAARAAVSHGPPRPLIHQDSPRTAPAGATAHAPGSHKPAAGAPAAAHAHANGHRHRHHKRRKGMSAWVWAAPAVGVLGLGWLMIVWMGGSSPGVADAGASQVVPTAAVNADVGAEIDAIIDAAAVALGTVRDAATADAAAPTLKDLASRLDAAKRAYDRLPPDEKRNIGHRVSNALGSRLRNAFERVHGADDTRRRLGPLAESLARKLHDFRPE